MSSSFRIWMALGAVIIPVAVLAQGTTAPSTAAPANKTPAKAQGGKVTTPTTDQAENVHLKNSEQGGTSVWDDNRGLGHMTKDVVLWQDGEDFILYAQDLTYSRPNNKAVATGKLRIETRNSTIVGDRLTGDFNEKMLTMTGHVTITSHGKKDGIVQKDRDDPQSKPVKITCERLDWDYETSQAKITGNINISQETRSGTCNLIKYDEPSNVAILVGNVRFGDEKKNTFTTDELTVFLNDNQTQSDKVSTITIPKGQDDTGNGTNKSRTPRKPEAMPGKKGIDISVFGTSAAPVPANATTPTPRPTDVVAPTPPPAPDEN